ncbi:MAG: hypothetical protein EBS31_04865 [Burkholderiaceae bacterium]|nr:hypothetical protein [Burkholderiaceae bacterium]
MGRYEVTLSPFSNPTNQMKITITNIQFGNDITDVAHIITLSDGRTISAWNGNASYSVPDEAKGRVEVGAELVSVEEKIQFGEAYKIFTFA